MLQVRYCKNCGQDFVTDIDNADYCDGCLRDFVTDIDDSDSCLLENEEEYEEK